MAGLVTSIESSQPSLQIFYLAVIGEVFCHVNKNSTVHSYNIWSHTSLSNMSLRSGSSSTGVQRHWWNSYGPLIFQLLKIKKNKKRQLHKDSSWHKRRSHSTALGHTDSRSQKCTHLTVWRWKNCNPRTIKPVALVHVDVRGSAVASMSTVFSGALHQAVRCIDFRLGDLRMPFEKDLPVRHMYGFSRVKIAI